MYECNFNIKEIIYLFNIYMHVPAIKLIILIECRNVYSVNKIHVLCV